VRLSLTPILLGLQLGFFFALAARAHAQRGTQLYLIGLAAYAIVSCFALAYGASGFGLQLATMAICALPVLLSRRLRKGLRQIVVATPWHWFAYFQGLRVAAIGTAYKTLIGEFPVYFELFVGLPDLAFGLSAFWIADRAKRGALSVKAFRRWNVLGALVIVPAAPLLLLLLPDMEALLAFPMSIAPAIVVPLFVLTNVLVAWSTRSPQNQPDG
jgi:hypothetical protein